MLHIWLYKIGTKSQNVMLTYCAVNHVAAPAISSRTAQSKGEKKEELEWSLDRCIWTEPRARLCHIHEDPLPYPQTHLLTSLCGRHEPQTPCKCVRTRVCVFVLFDSWTVLLVCLLEWKHYKSFEFVYVCVMCTDVCIIVA